MPTKTAAKTKEPSAVERVLAAGKTSRVDVASGRMQELRADCPTDGAPSTVRRVSREHGGGILEVTMRCPRCYSDFTAASDKLYLN